MSVLAGIVPVTDVSRPQHAASKPFQNSWSLFEQDGAATRQVGQDGVLAGSVPVTDVSRPQHAALEPCCVAISTFEAF